MKSILYIGGFELPDRNAAAQRVIGNSYALRELGYNIILYGVSKKKLAKQEIEKGIYYYEKKYPQSLYEWLLYLVSVKDYIQIIENDPTIEYVICYNYPAVALWRIKQYCNRRGIHIIGDVTEWYQGEGHLFHKLVKNLDTLIRMRFLHSSLDGLIVISKYLENYYKDKVKTICIPPLVNKKDVKWKHSEIEKEENYIKLVYAGSPGKNKDKLNKIVEFLHEVNKNTKKSIQLYIIGITKNDFLSLYPDSVDSISKTLDKIIFCGRIEHSEVINILKRADFSIFFREKNRVTMAGFPTKFAESISCGIPVITTKTSDLEIYLKNGYNGFWLSSNLDTSLNSIFGKNDIRSLKKIKKNINSQEFHFENYIKYFSELFIR